MRFMSLVESVSPERSMFSELAEPARASDQPADTVLTASVESTDENGHLSELILSDNA